jgi:hypothetical protein
MRDGFSIFLSNPCCSILTIFKFPYKLSGLTEIGRQAQKGTKKAAPIR